MTLTERGEAVLAWFVIIVLTSLIGWLFVIALEFGDDLRCTRLKADPKASDYTTDYYCDDRS